MKNAPISCSRWAFLLLLLVAVCAANATSLSSRGQVYHVADTELARLSTLTEVLSHLPGFTVSDEGISLVGHGEAVVYIDRRRVFNPAELSQVDASRVDSIEVLIMPGAVYGSNVEAVLLVSVRDLTAGFHIDEHAHLTTWRALSWANELALDWQREKLTLKGFFAFSDKNTDETFNQFSNTYSPSYQCTSQERMVSRRTYLTRQATARAAMDYRFSDSHALSVRYEYMCEPDKLVRNERTVSLYSAPNLDSLASKTNIVQSEIDYLATHTGNIAYTGHAGIATLDLNVDTRYSLETSHSQEIDQNGDRYVEQDNERFSQLNSEIRFSAALAAWQGGLLTLGTEAEIVWQRNSLHSGLDSLSMQDGLVSDYTFGLYAMVEHAWGDFSVKGGIRYEYEQLDYHVGDTLASRRPTHSPLPQLTFRYAPGDWLASLNYTSTVFTPNYKTFHIRNHDFRAGMDVIIGQSIERRHIASLTLGWQWIRAQMTYTYYHNPAFTARDSKKGFNGPDYSSLGTQLTLSPTIACWHPVLSAHLYKQWLDMELANGRPEVLRHPLFRLEFNNTFTLPLDFALRADFSYRSMGTEGNVRYYSPYFHLAVALQKDFLDHRLSLTLSGTNLLGLEKRDVTFYEPASRTAINQGEMTCPDPSVSFSIRYRM